MQLALGADIRLAHPDARLSVMEIKWGLIPDMSGTQTLRDLVRLDVAKELVWSGRVVGAKEADPRHGKISNESPIGKALMDHKVGDVVEAETPGGKIRFKILKVE